MPTLRLALVFALLVGIASRADADWPHVRGPRYDGVCLEAGLADAWPADGPPLLWSRELGQGYSGFILADGKLFTQRQSLGGQYLLCLDPANGQVIWEVRYDWAWQPKGAYPGPYASPTWYRGNVCYASPSGKVGCVNANTGAEVWSVNLKERFKGKGWGFGYAATPLVEDDKVILPVGGPNASLVALHVDDGRTVWQVGDDPASYCPALPITFKGRRCVVGYLQNALVLVDLATGALLHRQPLSGGYDEHSAWPIYREPHLWLAGPFHVPATRYELDADAGGTIACKPQWVKKEMSNDVVSSVLYKDALYGFDLKQQQSSPHRASRGVFKCLDWATGKVNWATQEVGHAAPLSADDKLYLLTDTGTLILARADPSAYDELARTQLFADEICWTPPLIWQGRLFARSPSKVVCVHVGLPDRTIEPTSVPANVRTWRIDASWLLTRERDYPNDAPTWEEMAIWYAACLAMLAIGALAALVVRRASTWVFVGITFVLGVLGPNLLSALVDQCLFTWPVSLYVAFHVVTAAYASAARAESPCRARWLARFAAVVFVGVICVYYEACRWVGMYIFWSFLIGFPAALFPTYLAVRLPADQRRWWLSALWTLLAFTAFFWSAQGMFLWKTSRAESP